MANVTNVKAQLCPPNPLRPPPLLPPFAGLWVGLARPPLCSTYSETSSSDGSLPLLRRRLLLPLPQRCPLQRRARRQHQRGCPFPTAPPKRDIREDKDLRRWRRGSLPYSCYTASWAARCARRSKYRILGSPLGVSCLDVSDYRSSAYPVHSGTVSVM